MGFYLFFLFYYLFLFIKSLPLNEKNSLLLSIFYNTGGGLDQVTHTEEEYAQIT